MRSIVPFVLLGLFLAVPAGVVAQETPSEAPPMASTLSEDEQNQFALKLITAYMSPYCPGANLRDCGSGQAEVLRQRIRGWIAEGRTEDWITEQLVAEFGEMILGAPRFKGWGSIAYIAPVLALLIGLGAVMAFLQRQKDAASQRPVDEIQAPRGFQLTREIEDAVDRELKHRSQ